MTSFANQALLKPVKRGAICTIAAVGWYLTSGYLFLVFFPQFGLYNTIISNMGTNTFDVYFFWSWIPTLIIFVFGGIFWASGLGAKIMEVLENA